jgi:catechol 2,3-dioxygenase-like lactoylglutathione lyase family enzyme
MHVTGLDHIVLVCSDVERSLSWYCDKLGLAAERVDEWRRGEAPFPSVRIDERTLIDLVVGERAGVNMDHVCLVVEPTDLAALASSGEFDVVGEGAVDGLFGAQGYATSLYVHDPDGNVVELRHYG